MKFQQNTLLFGGKELNAYLVVFKFKYINTHLSSGFIFKEPNMHEAKLI